MKLLPSRLATALRTNWLNSGAPQSLMAMLRCRTNMSSLESHARQLRAGWAVYLNQDSYQLGE